MPPLLVGGTVWPGMEPPGRGPLQSPRPVQWEDMRTCLYHHWEPRKVSQQWKAVFPAGLQKVHLAEDTRNLADRLLLTSPAVSPPWPPSTPCPHPSPNCRRVQDLPCPRHQPSLYVACPSCTAFPRLWAPFNSCASSCCQACSPHKLRANREVPVQTQDGGMERLRLRAEVGKASVPARGGRQGVRRSQPPAALHRWPCLGF
ncbi:dexamethasone-induced protein isoform X2 [Diceros bicornis minor]|uniref:dexamethasone-induced protein isoform X2 n=1 Tax=Diceros bicornis minor TaxID=77932 RepID=UPI0026F1E6D7|nr:dexamethasone-induced protein isoform X2 [Diceros bicornis minor]